MCTCYYEKTRLDDPKCQKSLCDFLLSIIGELGVTPVTTWAGRIMLVVSKYANISLHNI